MKQSIILGQKVDDGSGDYLRAGGLKTNNNFDDLYYQLGDGANPHAAGAWKTHKASTNVVLKPSFGQAFAIDTAAGRVTVELPKGTVNDYNKVIRVRDVFQTWRVNPVVLKAATGDTIKGNATPVTIDTDFSDLELVYCAPGRWEYVANKQVSRISTSDQASVARKEFIATAGQTDFLNVFGDTPYNVRNTQVYVRGNMLYYGNNITADSDYGSPGATPGSLVALDGKSIRLRNPCVAGDTVIVVTFLDGIAQYRSSYTRKDIVLLDTKKTDATSVPGSTIVTDLATFNTLTIDQLGHTAADELINKNTLEVSINGTLLNEAGKAGQPLFRCDGADASNQADCVAMNGTWKESNTDYRINDTDDGLGIESILFDRIFEHGDIVTLRWYNNDIGTTMDLEDILANTDTKYINQGLPIRISGDVRVTSVANPAWPNVEPVDPYDLVVDSPSRMFELVYPIGTVYENFINPNNPYTYMGFGTWVLAGTSRVLVGWTNDDQDTLFGLNNNHLDTNGNPMKTAGGTGGVRANTLVQDNIPKMTTDEKVLVVDDNGSIVVGGCQFDPDDEGPAYSKYREDNATIVGANTPAKDISNIQPFVTVYRWMRVA